MNLQTYLMIKQADIVFKRKSPVDLISDAEWDARENNYTKDPEIAKIDYIMEKALGNMPAGRERAMQRKWGPRGVVPVMDNTPTFGKKPVKALPGIGPMPAGLDYGN